MERGPRHKEGNRKSKIRAEENGRNQEVSREDGKSGERQTCRHSMGSWWFARGLL